MKAVILMGPTGAGKTALGMQLAKEFDGEIINADSRQVYAGMDVGTAKPASPEWRKENGERRMGRDEAVLIKGVPHLLIDILTPDQQYSAAAFRDDARRIIADIHRRGTLPIVVGGTGFYLRALTGERELPNVPPDPWFRAWAARQPVAALAADLQRISPDLFRKVDNPRNRRRVTRQLEVARAGARKLTADSYQLTARTLKIALLPPREVLRDRIAARVVEMFQRGFVEEARTLVRRYGADAPGLQTTGYREIIRGLAAGVPEDALREAVIRAHWATARRQMTWLKREPSLERVADAAAAGKIVRAFLRHAE